MADRGAFVSDWKCCRDMRYHTQAPPTPGPTAIHHAGPHQHLQALAWSFDSQLEGSPSALLSGTFAGQQLALPIEANGFELTFSLNCYFLFLGTRSMLCR